ncbi:ABC transporter ATP-binding protein [Candidatus Halobonum tyrrellensis]|uniref:Oligopeptide/dipeptide ABC transporter ATPase n=1 Tax=Candidatus Halobonum tyrrellensis G22 TaxID=1324957 RepID=V4GNP3_9EURY|nr:ABC transporter ATP-binding protein [Candidatus Halobonum tyrrellensis]ESP87011.1 oligopeptide/dipeptide ABC transporter ATPase [Candidatus Halobonum tyrrellensis G22]
MSKPDPTTPVVSLEDVTVEFSDSGGPLGLFGDEEVVTAVDDVSLDIGEREIVTLIGESGCGKSTLGKTAIGAQRPTGGSVKYRGQDVWEAKDGNGDVPFEEIRRSLQIIHQDPGSALNPNQRVMTSLMLPIKRWNPDLSREQREERVYTLLERVGMSPAEDYLNRYPHQLSGGEKQRVVLVRAMLLNPDLILADEAISALDVSLRVEMMDLMLELQDVFDTSYLFISHDLSNARYIAEKAGGRIAVMYLGQIVEIGTVDEIIDDPTHPYTKALKWATPNLFGEEPDTEFPIRTIDVPDPTNLPDGCRFHTRCPEAREVCTREDPPPFEIGVEEHRARCFRADPDHEYWDSPEITDDDTEAGPGAGAVGSEAGD